MSNEIKLPKLVYKGCDNPKDYLLEQEGNRPCSNMKPMTYDEVKELLQKQTDYKLPRPEPLGWCARTWDEHVKVCLHRAKVDDICFREKRRFSAMNLSTLVKSMSNVVTTGSFSVDEIWQAERALGVSFAEDYKEVLCSFGCVDIFRSHLCNLSPGDDNVVSLTKEYRMMFSTLDKKYYVLFDLGCETMWALSFLQDSHGYIYSLEQNGVFKPVFFSLSDLLIDIWVMSMQGYM